MSVPGIRRATGVTPAIRAIRQVMIVALGALSVALIAGTLACSGESKPTATVTVDLTEWDVKPSVSELPAGKIRFVGVNRGATTHELAVLSVDPGGAMREVADVEGIKSGKSGEFTTTLTAGQYQLVCLIVPGQEGSTVDHYKQGMHVPFVVK